MAAFHGVCEGVSSGRKPPGGRLSAALPINELVLQHERPRSSGPLSFNFRVIWAVFFTLASLEADRTRCAEELFFARERRFPSTIAELYDLEKMLGDLRRVFDGKGEG